jgi:Tfp pilus assembly protein PilO
METADLIARIKKQPIGFACGVLCIVFGALIYFRSEKITEYQKIYDAKAAEAATISANVSIAKTLPEQVAEIQGFTKEMESRLVHASQLAVNLQYFYKLEAENEVKIIDVHQNTPPRNTKTAYTGIPYSLSVQGPYKQVMSFLQQLENGRHFCRITSASFTKVGSGTDPQSTGMALSLNIELLGQL